MTALLALCVLALSGLPLSRRLAGDTAECAVLAPLLGAGYLAAAAAVEVAVGGSMLLLGSLALAIGFIAPLALSRPLWRRPHLPWSELLLLVAPCLVLLWTLTALQGYRLDWDARSIWLFHARMLLGGQDLFLDQARQFPFSHPDYPPLAPAAVSYTWELFGHVSYRTAQVLIAALTAAATVLVGLAIGRAVGGPRVAPVAAAAAVATSYGVWDTHATNGQVDALVAALLLAAASYAFLAPREPRHLRLALAAAVLAAATKNEGLAFALVVIVMLCLGELIRRRRSGCAPVTPLRWLAVSAGLIIVWPLIVRAHGIDSGLTDQPPLQGAAADPVSRLGVVNDALLPMLDLVAWSAAGVLVMSLVVGGEALRRSASFCLAVVLCTTTVLAAYALGPYEINFWVSTSLPRTSMVLRAGGLLAAIYAAGLATHYLLPGGRAHLPRSAGPPDETSSPSPTVGRSEVAAAEAPAQDREALVAAPPPAGGH